MNHELELRLKSAPIVPLIQADDPVVAVDTANALMAGGLTVLEVVLRTEGALNCLQRIAERVPGVIVGAGTVLSAEHAVKSLDAGAAFLVSPGLHVPVVETALDANVDVFPGVATPSEAQLAWNLGLRAMKFFPAGQMGGVPMLKALSSVFRGVSFMPTGGVSEENLGDYLRLPSVLACGGSWLTPSSMIDQGRFDEVTRLAGNALAIAANMRN